jgi:hypothetical protein
MPMPLLDVALPITLGDDRARQEFGRVGTQPHGSAKVAAAVQNRYLLSHGRDHRMRRFGRELAAVGSIQGSHMARHLDHHALQAQAESQDRDLIFACIANSADLAFDATYAKATGYDDAVHLAQDPGGALPSLAIVRWHPTNHHPGVIRKTARSQCLADRKVRIVKIDILADQGDCDLFLRVVDAIKQVVPARPVHVTEPQVQPAHHVRVQAL